MRNNRVAYQADRASTKATKRLLKGERDPEKDAMTIQDRIERTLLPMAQERA
jgi:hypothetical protein